MYSCSVHAIHDVVLCFLLQNTLQKSVIEKTYHGIPKMWEKKDIFTCDELFPTKSL